MTDVRNNTTMIDDETNTNNTLQAEGSPLGVRAEGMDAKLLKVARGGRGGDDHSDDDDLNGSSSGGDSDDDDDNEQQQNENDELKAAEFAGGDTAEPSPTSGDTANPSPTKSSPNSDNNNKEVIPFPFVTEVVHVEKKKSSNKNKKTTTDADAQQDKDDDDDSDDACNTIATICEAYVLEESTFRRINPRIPSHLATDAVLPHGTKINIPKTNVMLHEEQISDENTGLSLATISRVKLHTVKAFCDSFRMTEQQFRDCNPSIPKDYGYEERLPRFGLIKLPLTVSVQAGLAVLNGPRFFSPKFFSFLSIFAVVLLSIVVAYLQNTDGQEKAMMFRWIKYYVGL